MRLAARVDEEGYFLEDVLVGEEVPAGCIGERPPGGLHAPRWTGSAWEEGKPEAEILEAKKAAKEGEIAAGAVDALRPHVTGPHGDREMLYVLAKHVEAVFEAQGLPLDPRLSALIGAGDTAMAKKAEIEAAGTAEELEGVSWT